MQSNAFDKSIRTAPTMFLLSKDFFHSSMSHIKTWLELCVLYAARKCEKVFSVKLVKL